MLRLLLTPHTNLKLLMCRGYAQREPILVIVHAGKWKAVVTEIKRMNKTGRPVLVGTTSVERSEVLAGMLKEAGIKCQVCNLSSHLLQPALTYL